MFKNLVALTLIAPCAVLLVSSCGVAQEYRSGIKWPEPPIITPGKTNADPPSDAIILFDGRDLSAWENGDKWIVKDGVAIVNGATITTKQSFGDCQLHIEWSSPVPATGKSQGRGNSGVFFMDRYELQVLDSYNNKTYFDGQASAIYKQTPPLVNAMRPPGEWNTYDAIWTAPRFKSDGELESPAYITVLHNGVLTLNHVALEGVTDFPEYPHYEMHGKAPIHLQNHGNPVRYRNIWVREIKPLVGVREREPYFHDHKTDKDTPVDRSAPVNGKIMVDGKPLENGKISFRSNKGDEMLKTEVHDGKYAINNLKPGVYVVSIQTTGGGAKLPERYNTKSEFTRNIRPGRNEIDYELKSN